MDKQLKDLTHKNKMLKRDIKSTEAELGRITAAFPDYDNLPSSLDRTTPKVRLFR